MDCSAAHLPPILDHFRARHRSPCGLRIPVRVRLAPQVVGHGREHGVLDFVVLKIFLAEIGPLLQDHHAEAGGGKLLGHDPARRARADDQEIDFF